MAEHPHTSIDIKSEIQYDDSTLSSSRIESLKGSVFIPHKKDKSALLSGDKTPLWKKPHPKKPKQSSNKGDNTKSTKVTQNLKQVFNNLKHKNRRVT